MSGLSKQLFALGVFATAVLIPVGMKYQSEQEAVVNSTGSHSPSASQAPSNDGTVPFEVKQVPTTAARPTTSSTSAGKRATVTTVKRVQVVNSSSAKKAAAEKAAKAKAKAADKSRVQWATHAKAKKKPVASTTTAKRSSTSVKPPAPTTSAKPATPTTPKPTAPAVTVPAPAKGERCVASMYDEPQMTATGEVFDPKGMTVAHKTLPLNSYIKVTNPKNGKTVTLRVNDRGPYVGGRCLDLSKAAFKAISAGESGLMTVVWQRV